MISHVKKKKTESSKDGNEGGGLLYTKGQRGAL